MYQLPRQELVYHVLAPKAKERMTMRITIKKEIWKDIKGYEGLYKVSNRGNIKSLNYRRKLGNERILPGSCDGKGYLQVGLCKNGVRRKFAIHRLVAEAFIENKYNKKEVNHIDGNKSNNHVDNLEWSTRSENVKHAYDNGLISKKYGIKNPNFGKKMALSNSRKVFCITTNEIFESITEASLKYNIHRSNISRCCKGKMKTCGKINGAKAEWAYYEDIAIKLNKLK